MELGLQALLAFTPIALSGVLLVGLGWSAKRAMPLVYVVTAVIALTAWGMVVELAKAHEGQRILIHAGAGGVGHFAVRYAKHLVGVGVEVVIGKHPISP